MVLLDLREATGLPISLTEGGRLICDEGVKCEEVSERTPEQVKPFLLDPNSVPDGGALYVMHRDVYAREHREELLRAGLRYDITCIRPGILGEEHVKTVGHYHPRKPGSDVTYPELYEVVCGQAIFLLQKPGGGAGDRIVRFIAVWAQTGDKVVVPPGFGHVTVNPGDTWLVLANWVARGFSSLYDEFRSLRGAAYYCLAGEPPALRKNDLYAAVPAPERLVGTQLWGLDLSPDRPIYTQFLESSERFRFLTRPEEVHWED